jgi:demethylmenaquinone methyltransferase/2-methoxy-6-polyprenyl-1,4-benzoquinol methylase
MFNEVPRRYDLLNRLLTFGIDQSWRQRAANACFEEGATRIMDLCTGTGDLALLLAARASKDTRIVAVDFAQPMLEVAEGKARAKNLHHLLEFRHADAGDLPFDDGEFDAIGIAFAFRNLTYRNPRCRLYLSEMARILRCKGRLVIAETSQPTNSLWKGGFHFYLQNIVAPVGGLVSGHRPAYRYLAHSVADYYKPQEVSEMLQKAGFGRVEATPLMGGVAALLVATR